MIDEKTDEVKVQSNSYNQIAKATGIFGGVQVINILLSIIRSKFIAVLLGTSGLGIMGLFSATIGMIASVTGLGIGFSAVRTISSAARTNNQTLISRTIITLRRWVKITGIIGALITLILAAQLSQLTFGTNQYTWAFIWLSITLFFQTLSAGQLSLLQGLRMIKQLAKANVLGSIAGLCFSLLFYYWLGIDGIIPSLVVTAGLSLLFSWYFTLNVKVEKVEISMKESFTDGIDMVKLGSVTMITGFATTGVMYLIRLYIGRTGGLEHIGLYTAAWAILNGYVGVVFTAMGTDYFPRLSEINHDNSQVKKLVNEQSEISILILGPILILLLSSLPLVIQILLSSSFLPITDLIQWALIGMLFKTASWAISFIVLAKGDSKVFFFLEIIGNIIVLGSNILLYHFFNLKGIGFAFLLSYVLYLLVVFLFVRRRYNFSFGSPFIKLFLIQFALTSAALILVWQLGFPRAYITGAVILLVSTLYSFYELKNRIDLSVIVKRIKGNKS